MTERISRSIVRPQGGLCRAWHATGLNFARQRDIGSRRGVAILLVIVAVAAAAVIGSAYVANRLNAPQVVANVNNGAQARHLADSGADIATAIMECETIDWRSLQANGVLVDSLPIGDGTVTIRVSNYDGQVPDADTEYPLISSEGTVGRMNQTVAAQANTPVPERVEEEISVDLSEFAVFGATGITVSPGRIARWNAGPMADLCLPVNIGSNATARGSMRLDNRPSAPDSRGFVMASAEAGTIIDSALSYRPIPRVNFSNNETVLLPAPPTPPLSGLTWASSRTPNITANASIVSTSDKRYSSFTVNGATLTVDLGGAGRTMGISGNLSMDNGAVLSIQNGHLDLVVQGALNMFNRSTIDLGPTATMRIFLGGTMSIDDSVVGMPVGETAASRDARYPIANYYDPQRCVIYRITSINSIDLNLLDFDDATAWVWSDTTSKSWMINNKSAVCARIYGHSKADVSLNTRSAVYGNVVGRTVSIAGESAVYYDSALDRGTGYTNPKSRLYAGPLNLRDDIRLLLTDLNPGTLGAILALLNGGGEDPIFVDLGAPTPRDAARVQRRAWRQYGLKIWRDRKLAGDDLAAEE